MFVTLLSALATFMLSLILTPMIRRLATKGNVIAAPNHRSVHRTSIPKLGGLAIFLSFAAGAGFLHWFGGGTGVIPGFFLGAAVVVVLGFFDDIYTLNCYAKLMVQTAAALIAVSYGFCIETVVLPWGSSIELGVWSFPLSVFWIVSIMNALNLLDGLDGLAAGFVVLVGSYLLLIGGMTGNMVWAAMVLLVIMATLGFLKYNFPPATIFMGDTGSLFLGFSMACLAMKIFTFGESGTNILAMVAPFSVPLLDTAIVTVRRIVEGGHPFTADKKHVHHLLLEQGLNQLSAVVIIYFASALFAVASLSLLVVDANIALFILFAAVCMFIVGVTVLGGFDFLARKGGFDEAARFHVEEGETLG